MLNFVVVVAAITPRQHADAEAASAFLCTSRRACLRILAVFNKQSCPLTKFLYKKARRLHWHKFCCAFFRSLGEVESERPDNESGFPMPPWCFPLKRCPVQPEIVKALAKEVANCRLQASQSRTKYQRRRRAMRIVARRTRKESRGICEPFPQ